jgi:hypothetical protein
MACFTSGLLRWFVKVLKNPLMAGYFFSSICQKIQDYNPDAFT